MVRHYPKRIHFKELIKIEEQLVKLQEKFRLQVEHSQQFGNRTEQEKEKKDYKKLLCKKETDWRGIFMIQ